MLELSQNRQSALNDIRQDQLDRNVLRFWSHVLGWRPLAIPFEKLKARPPAHPKIGAEHDALAPEFEIAVELRRARLSAGLLQAELAARIGSS